METVQNQPPKPSNYLILSIISLVVCCLPASIVSVIYAAQVNSKYNAGDYEGSVKASKNAKTWLLVSVIISVILVVTTIVFIVVFGADEFMEAYNAELEKNNR